MLVIFSFLTVSTAVFAGDAQETYAYKLALLYTRQLNPTEALTNPSLNPERSTLTEFQWLLESLTNRCQGSEESITATLMQTWKYLKKSGQKPDLLEMTRTLNKFTQDKKIFGFGKINFRQAANRWLIQQRSGK